MKWCLIPPALPQQTPRATACHLEIHHQKYEYSKMKNFTGGREDSPIMDIRIPAQGDAYDVSRMALTPSTASFSTSLMRNADNSIMLSDDAVRCSSEDQCSQSKNETNATTGSAALMQDSMPALNLPNIDFSSMKPNFRSSNEDSLHGIRRPIAIRPSSLNSSYHLAVRSSVTGAPDARQDRYYPLL